MSAFRAGHLRKAPVAAAMIIGGGIGGMRAALGPNTGNPLQITTLHASGAFLSNASADVDLTCRLFSCSPTSQYEGSPWVTTAILPQTNIRSSPRYRILVALAFANAARTMTERIRELGPNPLKGNGEFGMQNAEQEAEENEGFRGRR